MFYQLIFENVLLFSMLGRTHIRVEQEDAPVAQNDGHTVKSLGPRNVPYKHERLRHSSMLRRTFYIAGHVGCRLRVEVRLESQTLARDRDLDESQNPALCFLP